MLSGFTQWGFPIRSVGSMNATLMNILKTVARHRLVRLAALVVALGLHTCLVLRNYPLACWQADEVPFRGDVSRYYATAVAAAAVGGLYGYDPYNMAGYPVGLWNSMGKKGFEVLHLLLPGVSLPRLFYGALVGVSLLAPLLIWGAVLPFRELRRHAALLLALCLLYWHLSTEVAYFWSFGNVFFPGASALLVVMTAAAHAVLTDKRPWLAAVLLGLCAAAVFYAHTVVLLAGVLPLLTLLVLQGRAHVRGRHLLRIALALGLFLVLILPWLVPLLQSRGDCVPQPKAWFQSGPKTLVMDLFSDRVYRQPFDRNFLYRAAVVLGLVGMRLAWRKQPLVVALGSGGLGALVLAYGASYVEALQSIQPYRFVIPATLLFLVPAAVALQAGAEAARAAPRATRALVAVLLVLLAPQGSAYLIDLAWPRDPAGLTADQREAIAHFQAVPPTGRVFVDDPELGHLLPALASVSVLGGLSSQAFLKHRVAGVDEDHIAFGRHARDWDPVSLQRKLNTYGVELALLTTKPWQNVAARMPGMFEAVGAVAGRPCFRVRGDAPSLVLAGTAEVRADYAGIHVRGAAPGVLVLKFHYADWLDAGPGVTLHPEPIPESPIPFIRADVVAGTPDFTIRRHGPAGTTGAR